MRGTVVRVIKINGEDFVCLTDMAKLKSEDAQQTISNWMRNRMTIEYLGLWETLYNPNFKPTEFGRFREESGLNAFVLSPTKWIKATNAIGIVAHSGRYGGTYARSDIAFKFAAWLSVEFELYLVKEFQRLKTKEQELIGWSAKRSFRRDKPTGAQRQHHLPQKPFPDNMTKSLRLAPMRPLDPALLPDVFLKVAKGLNKPFTRANQ